uniref:Uncharacterized protein n=1 Tax=Kalanchoe fedtschenkoi TaxID=63787 RepID=A0A7N0UMM0_KALFE
MIQQSRGYLLGEIELEGANHNYKVGVLGNCCLLLLCSSFCCLCIKSLLRQQVFLNAEVLGCEVLHHLRSLFYSSLFFVSHYNTWMGWACRLCLKSYMLCHWVNNKLDHQLFRLLGLLATLKLFYVFCHGFAAVKVIQYIIYTFFSCASIDKVLNADEATEK